MVRSTAGCSSSVDVFRPTSSASFSVASEVEMPMTLMPPLTISPILRTAWAAVLPVPRPTTMPSSTISHAFHAASFISSCWSFAMVSPRL